MISFDGLWFWCRDTLKTGDFSPLSEMAAILHPLLLVNSLLALKLGCNGDLAVKKAKREGLGGNFTSSV
jgi:hypothetical protein